MKIIDLWKELLWNTILRKEGKEDTTVCMLPQENDDGIVWVRREDIKNHDITS